MSVLANGRATFFPFCINLCIPGITSCWFPLKHFTRVRIVALYQVYCTGTGFVLEVS